MWSGVGAQLMQRGDLPELRGQAATQVVDLKVPVRGAPERVHETIQGAASAKGALPLGVAALPPHPTPPHPTRLPRLGGWGSELQWLTGSLA